MKDDFMKYMFVSLVNYFLTKEEDVEEAIKKIGYEMGKKILILNNFKQEKSLDGLLYRIVYILLPSLYSAKCKLVISTTDENTYLITENKPIMKKNISLPQSFNSFSPDALIAGIIESILFASGFCADVTAHNVESLVHLDKVVYVIKINKES